MTQGPNRLMDEFAKLMTDAAGVAQSVRREAETVFRTQAEKLMGEMDVVSNDAFQAVKEMAAKAREENDRLNERIAELEARVSKLEGQKRQSGTTGKQKS